MNENQFETALIQHLTVMSGTKQWRYEPTIKTTEGLWLNFKRILESLNRERLDQPLSDTEFEQVKRAITGLKTPYEAGQFLYGHNGTSQIHVNLDNGQIACLTVFDQRQIGAGNTVYQVVNQIERQAVQYGKQNRRFDTTLLINGLPIIQIEEKSGRHSVDEALNQMHQYAAEGQFGDIFSTLQILIGMSPNEIKYMANTSADSFNKDFAFRWQDEENKVITNWKDFSQRMLSIPMAHKMATNFMILDGTKNKQMLKVMRPYQVYATQKALDAIEKIDFDFGINKAGYIWHTTGSGKTITSFKTAWLASRMPGVDKVVFVVDRIALTRQTAENYKAYDPDSATTTSKFGSVEDTESTKDLERKLKSNENNIVVTSIQKLDTLVKRKHFTPPVKNIVFIVDEAHRSTGGESFPLIQKAFKRSAWIGYTGTPMFAETQTIVPTQKIFGDCLHSYTIREAIADRNVLGFKVDFETTIDEEQMKSTYLPEFYAAQYPDWTAQQVQQKIESLTPEDMDDEVKPSFYDNNDTHVALVVADIFKNWRNRSNDGLYSAILTTHVGGGKASSPMAMKYFDECQRLNALEVEAGRTGLRVAVTFSLNTSNNEAMKESNEGLFRAIQAYNAEFNTSWDMSDTQGYMQDVMSRLNRSCSDKKYLDLVIVIDQLLTGFDAPDVNTLYVDRTLKGAGLIQAYSRTNRIANMQEKPWGRIVNYRWPAMNERRMNEALALYANKNSALKTASEQAAMNIEDGIVAEPFQTVLARTQKIVESLRAMTEDFVALPASEERKEAMFDMLKDYSLNVAKLKQYDAHGADGFDYDNPEELISALGMSKTEEERLTVVLKNELKQHLAEIRQVPISQIELRMTHVKDIRVNFDYLTALIEKLLNQVHDGDEAGADQTHKEIQDFANTLADRTQAKHILEANDEIRSGNYNHPIYPAKLESYEDVITTASQQVRNRKYLAFIAHWGLLEVVTSAELQEMSLRHTLGKDDLNDDGRLDEILKGGKAQYKGLAASEIQALSPIKYNNQLRIGLKQFLDECVSE